MWNLESRLRERTLRGHTRRVNSVCISNDGKYIVSGSNDCDVRVWSYESGECLAVMSGHNGPVASVSITPDNKYVAYGSEDGCAYVWSLLDSGSISGDGGTLQTTLVRKWTSSPGALSFKNTTLDGCTGIATRNGRLIRQLGGSLPDTPP